MCDRTGGSDPLDVGLGDFFCGVVLPMAALALACTVIRAPVWWLVLPLRDHQAVIVAAIGTSELGLPLPPIGAVSRDVTAITAGTLIHAFCREWSVRADARAASYRVIGLT